MFAQVIPKEVVIHRCDCRKMLVTSTTAGSRVIAFIYHLSLLIGFSLSLTHLVYKVLKRVGVQSYQLSSNFWQILGDVASLNNIYEISIGINELFHHYSIQVEGDWLDFGLQ